MADETIETEVKETMIPESEVLGLKSALQKERESVKMASKDLGAYASLGKTPEELKALLEAQDQMEQKKALEKGEFDKLSQTMAEKYEAKLGEMQGTIEQLTKSEHNALATNTLMTELAKAGASEEGLKLLPTVLQSRIKVDTINGNREIVVLDSDGTQMLGTSGTNATVSDLVNQVSSEYQSLFKANLKSGSGTPPNSAGTATNQTMQRSQFDTLSAKEQASTMRSGVSLVD